MDDFHKAQASKLKERIKQIEIEFFDQEGEESESEKDSSGLHTESSESIDFRSNKGI
jgi:hypothetical protein